MRFALVLAASTLLGCASDDRLYAGKVELPESLEVGTGRYTVFEGRIFEKSRAPMEVSSMTATCTPSPICSAHVHESQVFVLAAATGVASLHIDLTHPITGRIERRELPVTVTATAAPPPLGIGAQLPMGVGKMLQLRIKGAEYHCTGLGPRSEGGLEFRCVPPLVRRQATFAFQPTHGQRAPKDEVRVCAALDGGAASSLTAYAPVNAREGDENAQCPKLNIANN